MRKSIFLLFALLFGFSVNAQNSENIIYSHLPGVYKEDISLNIQIADELKIYINFTSDIEDSWVIYKEPLELSALNGEEREYNIGIRVVQNYNNVLEQRELNFVIDKKLPLAPEIEPRSGEFTEELNISFVAQEDVFYSINGNIFKDAVLWDNSSILLYCEPGSKETFIIQAYTRDKAGNRSNVVSFDYIVDRTLFDNLPSELNVLSPVPGNYANYQLLYIKSLNIKWINYTLDGSDPVTGGMPYSTPINIIESGDVNLRIAAGTMSGEIITDEIDYNVSTEAQGRIISDVKSGVYDRSITINLFSTLTNDLYYTFSERSPGIYDYIYNENIVINAINNTEKYSILRVKARYPDGGWSEDYRFFFSIKTINLREELNGNIEGSESTEQSGRNTDFTKSNINELLTLEEFVQQYLSESVEDAITVEQEEMLINTRIDELISIDLSSSDKTNMPVIISVDRPDNIKVVYEISAEYPVSPSRNSPVAYGEMKLSVPYGMEETFIINFAVIENGNIYLINEPYYISIDKLSPGLPDFSVETNSVFDDSMTLEISGSGTILYEITNDGSTPKDPTEDSSKYTTPIHFFGRESQMTVYYIKVKSIDELGNESEITGPLKYTVDLRTPELPKIFGVQEGSIYNNHVVISMNTEILNIHYAVSDTGSEPALPSEDSPMVDGELIIRGEPDKFSTYTLYLKPYSKNYKQAGEIQSISFSIDMERPLIPIVSGFTQGAEYSREVEVTLEPQSEEDTIFVSYTYDGENVPDPVDEGEQYYYPLVFDVEDNEDAVIRLRFVSVDPYGNRSYPDEYYHFTIDKKPPLEPEVSGMPKNGISGEPVKIELLSGDGDVYYNVTEDGSIPLVPPLENEYLYNSALLFVGQDGEEVQYKIITLGIDVLGNVGKGSRILSFVIDRKPPELPPEPEIIDIYEEDENKILISWNIPAGHRLFYNYSDNLTTNSIYKFYIDPVVVHIEEGIYNFNVDYYIEDPAGNKSEEKSYSQRLSSIPSDPVISGADDGTLYNGPVTLDITNRSGVLRYELTVDGSEPAEVTKNSPELSSSITFDADLGETLFFKLRVCSFDSINPNIHSGVDQISFIIDKQMPNVPAVTGVADNGNYQESRTIEMQSDDGIIYYALKRGDEVIYGVSEEDFIPYTEKIEVAGVDEQSIPYLLEAYVIDEAGNRSIRNLKFEFNIDKVAIYVSVNGNDGYAGTKHDPLRSLNIALNYAAEKGIKTILVSGGNYEIDDTLLIDNDLELFGGLDPYTWEKTSDKTNINVSRYYNIGRPLIYITGGNISIDSIVLEEAYNNSVNIIKIEDGIVKIEHSEILINTKDSGNGIVITGGELTLNSIMFESANIVSGSLLKTLGGSVYVTSSEFRGMNNGDDFALINLENSTSVFEEIVMLPGAGRITRAMKIKNSQVSIDNCEINSGQGSQNAIGIETFLSNLNIINTTISNDEMANYCVSILSTDSNIFIERSVINVDSYLGATGIKANGGDILVSLSQIIGKENLEFIYLIDIENTSAGFYNNILAGGNSENTICVIINSSSSDWFNNTIIGGTGRIKTIGFTIKNASLTKLINNIITRNADYRGTALNIIGDQPAEIKTNCISGWDIILSHGINNIDSNPELINNIDSLNLMDSNSIGGNIHGNIVEAYFQMFAVTKLFEYKLNPLSACINAGTDTSVPPYNGPAIDIDLEARPAPEQDIKPKYDIGADEYY